MAIMVFSITGLFLKNIFSHLKKVILIFLIFNFTYRLVGIIDATGASSYHGFLPVLVRTCIQHMIGMFALRNESLETVVFCFCFFLSFSLITCNRDNRLSEVFLYCFYVLFVKSIFLRSPIA